MELQMKDKRNWALLALPFIFLFVFYFLPIGNIAAISIRQFNSGDYSNEMNWRLTTSAFNFTVFQATLSTVFTILVGLPAAYLFGRYVFKGKDVLRIASTLPFILPTVVVAAGFNALIGPKGWINIILIRVLGLSAAPINILNTLPAILLAHVFYNTSIIIRVVGAALAQVDRRFEDAARTLGASSWGAFRKITLPILFPSIISAVLLVFLFDFTSFGVILMMGGPKFTTLEVEIYIQTMQFLNLPLSGILSFIQLTFTMLVTFFLMRIDKSGFSIPIMPRLQAEGMQRPRLIWEKVLCGLVTTVLLLLLVAPVAALVLRSILAADLNSTEFLGQGQVISLRNFQELFNNRRQSYFYVPPIQAIWNSLQYGFFSSLISLILGFLLAYGLRQDRKENRAVELLMMLPLGTSAVTLGLGFFTFFSQGVGSARWFPFLIPAAHSLISLPYVLRIIQPVLNSIPVNLRWAAGTLGASPRDIVRYIDLPIIWRSLMTAALYAFTISLGEFGATSFLSRPDLPTMPIAVYRYLNLPGASNYGQAMAMAVIILMVCVVSMFALDRLQFQAIKDSK